MKEIYIIAGHNGSGKSTFAVEFLKEKNIPYVNADDIAKELSDEVDSVRLSAGKRFFEQIDIYITEGKSFAIESTLSGKYLLHLIEQWKQKGYVLHVVYVFLDSPDFAIDRIAIRVKRGGHLVPDEDVRRRFLRSKTNFWNQYKDFVDDWVIYYNGSDAPVMVASGRQNDYDIVDNNLFMLFKDGINE